MKRYIFSQYEGINPALPVPKGEIVEIPTERTDKDNVLDIIFANDSLTGRPRSDLGTYMTDDTNPLVREFIERNLRNDFSSNNQSVPDGIDAKDIAILTRDRFETVEDYTKRVNDYMRNQKAIVQNRIAAKNAAARRAERLKAAKEFEPVKE